MTKFFIRAPRAEVYMHDETGRLVGAEMAPHTATHLGIEGEVFDVDKDGWAEVPETIHDVATRVHLFEHKVVEPESDKLARPDVKKEPADKEEEPKVDRLAAARAAKAAKKAAGESKA